MKVKHTLEALRAPAIAVIIGLLTGGPVIAWSGSNPFAAIAGIIVGGYGSPYYLSATLTRATPIIFAGLASALAWGSGYETMGIAGQMTLGAFVSAITAVYCPGPTGFVIVMSLLMGMVTGAAFSLISAWISARFSVYLLIITLMMNYIAENTASYFTNYVFKDPDAADNLAIQTQKIEEHILPRLFADYTLHAGFLLALVCVAGILFMMKKTSFGYEARMTGQNAAFAKYGGINSRRNMYLILLISGAIAGLGGAGEVLGSRYRFIDEMITSPGYAWSGITASLMPSNNPVGIMFSSIFLAGLTTGAATIERSQNIPQEITSVIQGVITMFVTARFISGGASLKRLRGNKRGGVKDAA